MKRFIIRISLEFVAIVAAVIAAAQLVKSGYLALGVSILSIYAMFNLYRLGIEKVNTQRDGNIKEAQNDLLKGRLASAKAQQRRLEAVLVDAATEALWVSDIEVRGDKVAYVIDVPEKGRIVVYLPATEEDAKTEDAPAASEEG